MEAPEAPETVPGLRDNVLLGNALAEIEGQPEPAQLLNIARQLLQGHVFLRVKGDARALLAEGKDLPLAWWPNNGDEQLVLAYSGGMALRASVDADGDRDTSAMGQPVMALLRHVLAGPYAGIILDPASARIARCSPRRCSSAWSPKSTPNSASRRPCARPATTPRHPPSSTRSSRRLRCGSA